MASAPRQPGMGATVAKRTLCFALLACVAVAHSQRDNPYLLHPKPGATAQVSEALVPYLPGPAALHMQFPRDLPPERLVLLDPAGSPVPLQLTGTRRNGDGSWFARVHLLCAHRALTAQFPNSSPKYPTSAPTYTVSWDPDSPSLLIQRGPLTARLAVRSSQTAMRRDFETRVSGSVFAEFALTTVFANGGVHELILRSYHACPYLQLEHTAAGAAGSLDIATAATLTRVPEAPEFSTGRVRGLLAIGELGAFALPEFERGACPAPPSVPRAPSEAELEAWQAHLRESTVAREDLDQAYLAVKRWAVLESLRCERLEAIVRIAARLPGDPLRSPQWRQLVKQAAALRTPQLSPGYGRSFAGVYNMLTGAPASCLERALQLPRIAESAILADHAVILHTAGQAAAIWQAAAEPPLAVIAGGRVHGASWPLVPGAVAFDARFLAGTGNQLSWIRQGGRESTLAILANRFAVHATLGSASAITLQAHDDGAVGTTSTLSERAITLENDWACFGSGTQPSWGLRGRAAGILVHRTPDEFEILLTSPGMLRTSQFTLETAGEGVLRLNVPRRQGKVLRAHGQAAALAGMTISVAVAELLPSVETGGPAVHLPAMLTVVWDTPFQLTVPVSGIPAPKVTVAGLPDWLTYEPLTRDLRGQAPRDAQELELEFTARSSHSVAQARTRLLVRAQLPKLFEPLHINGEPAEHDPKQKRVGFTLTGDSSWSFGKPVAPQGQGLAARVRTVAPGGLELTLEEGQASLAWGPVAGAAGYVVYRREHPRAQWTALARCQAPEFTDRAKGIVASYAEPGLEAAAAIDMSDVRVFQYAVTAWNSRGESERSAPVDTDPRRQR